jgi:coenzyme F420 hydrogenase subunit beta
MTYAAIDYLIAKSGLRKGRINIHFRDKSVSGYPGDIHVFTDEGASVIMPSAVRMRAKDFFTPARCRICFDKMNVFSDLTVGDPHGIDSANGEEGESILVVRTETGRSIVQSALRNNAIRIRTIPYSQVCKGQGIDDKRRLWGKYVSAWRAGERKLPNYSDVVAVHAPIPTVDSKYIKDIESSLRLDSFRSRSEMTRHAEMILKKQQLTSHLLSPGRLLRRAARELYARLMPSEKPTME